MLLLLPVCTRTVTASSPKNIIGGGERLWAHTKKIDPPAPASSGCHPRRSRGQWSVLMLLTAARSAAATLVLFVLFASM